MEPTRRKRREAEVELRDSEARYRSLFKASPVAMWEEDHSLVKRHLDGLIAQGVKDITAHLHSHPDEYAYLVGLASVLDANAAAVKLLGADSLDDLLAHANDLELASAGQPLVGLWSALLSGACSASYETSCISLAGQRLHLIETCTVAPGCEETWERVFFADVDVTQTKLAEASLRRTQQAIETASDGFYEVSPEGRFTYVNRAAARSLGRSQEELIGMAPWEIGPALTERQWRAHWKRLRNEGSVHLESVHSTADGQLFPVEITSNFVVLGDGEYEFTYVHDISERKRTDKALTDSQARYRRMVETAAEGIALLDTQRRMTFVNNELCRLLGCRDEELVGASLDDLVMPEDVPRLIRRWAERQSGASGQYEIRLRRKDGSPRWVGISARPVFDEQGRFAGGLAMVTDIHERKRAEERSRRTLERLRLSVDAAVKTLARTIEIRDPYTAGHQERVTELASAIGERIRLPKRTLTSLRIASLIHDLGKIAVPAEILSRPGTLSEVEWKLIRQHPATGFEILREMRFPGPVAAIVRDHHERLDGSGYPRGLVGDEISLQARIVAVADVVEAMASHRPYRAALGIDAALKFVTDHAGSLFDQLVVTACLQLFGEDGFRFS